MPWFKTMFSSGLVVAAALAATGGGCGTISSDSTLQELLDASGLGSVTVGDVLNAIEAFTGQSASLPFGQTLTTDQEEQISALQDQLDAGEISGQEYVEQLISIVGVQAVGRPFDAGPGRAFGHGGFPGGPMEFQGGPPGGLNDELDLTDDQETQAQEIFDSMRDDIIALQEDAKTQIDAVLTDEQRDQLDSLDHRFHGAFRYFGPGLDASMLSDELGLTDEQQTQIESILDTLQTAADARRQQARDEFRAILTEEQLAVLDEFEASHDRTDE